MLKYGFRVAVAVSFSAIISAPAMALIGGQVLAGKRWASFSDDSYNNVSDTEYQAAVHVDPIPLVPVAFGLNLAVQNWNSDEWKATKAAGSELGLEVMAWLPMVPVITPYIKGRYTVMGNILTESDVAVEVDGVVTAATTATTAKYKTSGMHVVIGAKYSLIPLVSLLFEMDNAFGKIELEEVKTAAGKLPLTSDDKKAITMNSRAFLVGIDVGI